MNKELVASFRDGDNKKYKLYREFEEDDLWTVMNGRIRAFQGTADEVSAYCKDAGLMFELPRSEAAVEEVIVEAETLTDGQEVKEPLQEESPEETAVEEAVEETVEEAVAEQLEPEGEDAETNVTKTLDEQIAELQAKKEELKK